MKKIYFFVCMLFSVTTFAQTNTFPSSGRVGINTLSPAASLQVKGGARIGSLTNYLAVDSATGNLSFAGTSKYLVAGNKYAFQYASAPNYGLFFNSTLAQYEFRDGSALPVFLINANNGNGIFNGTLKVGAYTLPGTDGTSGQVLKTDGAGNLAWSADNNTTYAAGTGIDITGTTISNTAPDQTVSLTGTGATTVTGTYPNFTISSTDNNTSYTAGTGIDLTSNIITNTAPDQVVSLIGETGIGVTGTYPNFTLNGTYAAGTGLSLTGTTFTNTAPDQVVSLSATNGISVTGTYPNFTLGGAGLWNTNGNTGTNAANNFIGTTDAADLVFRTNNIEALRLVNSSKNLGIGTNNPLAKVHIKQGNSGTNIASSASGLLLENSSLVSIQLLAPSANDRSIIFGDNLNANDGAITYSGILNSMSFKTNGVGKMTIDSTGSLSTIGKTIKFGTIESFSDSGSNVIACNSDFINQSDGIFNGLGVSNHRWTDVWSIDGTINTSDAREKKNIRDLNYGLQDIMKLHPVRFKWIRGADDRDRMGVIAQEVQKVLPEAVWDYEYVRDETTGKEKKVPSAVLGINYDAFIPVLIRGMQQQQNIINDQNTKIDALQTQIDDLKKAIGIQSSNQQQQTSNQQVTLNQKPETASLEQNIPNPFSNTTTISCFLPANNGNAYINFYSQTGALLKSVKITGEGKNTITLTANELAAGTYKYALVVDGKVVDTKMMVLQK